MSGQTTPPLDASACAGFRVELKSPSGDLPHRPFSVVARRTPRVCISTMFPSDAHSSEDLPAPQPNGVMSISGNCRGGAPAIYCR